jgi:hypothetical protein
MTIIERRRLFELQDELGNEASRLVNSRMLLRPNTRFAVIWKILFVLCVVVEISQCAFAPSLSPDKHHGQSTRIEKFLEFYFVPTPTTQLPECRAKLLPQMKAMKGILIIRWIKKYNYRPNAGSQTSGILKRPPPWYCHEVASTLKTFYIRILKFAIHALSTFSVLSHSSTSSSHFSLANWIQRTAG